MTMSQDTFHTKINCYTSKRIGKDGRTWYGWEMMPPAKMLQLFYRMKKSVRNKNQKARIETHMKLLEAKMGIV